MLKMTKGSSVPMADKLSEQYEKREHTMLANVDAGKIESVLRHFICMQEGRMICLVN